MTYTTLPERKEFVLRIADEMAAAASSMNAQNYDILMNCRKELKERIDEWSDEDTARRFLLEDIQHRLEKFQNCFINKEKNNNYGAKEV